MRKTNPLHLFTFGLQRTAGPYSWVTMSQALTGDRPDRRRLQALQRSERMLELLPGYLQQAGKRPAQIRNQK